jgi:hypothetical protein
MNLRLLVSKICPLEAQHDPEMKNRITSIIFA